MDALLRVGALSQDYSTNFVSPNTEAEFQLENLLEKYRHQEKIKHKSLKCLFTGPPRVGKTTLKKRLLKIITNLVSSGEVSPSGGLEKPISVVIGDTRECVTVVLGSDLDWLPQHNMLHEAQLVVGFIDSQPTTQHPGEPTPSSPTPQLAPVTPGPSTPGPSTPGPSTPGPSIPDSPTPHPDPPTPRKAEADTLDDAKKLIQEVLAVRRLRTIKDIEKTTTLYLMDTGGQPEFHEIMPVILNGPALHMVFFNLSINLDQLIFIRFCQQDGTDAVITYKSSYTGKQMIYQLLSSLYYMYLNKHFSPQSEQATVQGLSLHNEPAAVLIGTHLDQLKEEQGEQEDQGKKIEEINDSLKELFNNVEFHDEAFLTYPKEDDNSLIFIPVNNYSGDEEEIKQLQAFLRKVIDKRFAPVELPSSWLLFHLILRHRYENSPGVCKLAECRALAKGCGLDEDDVRKVLRYIHHHLGTILFYEQVKGLKELVICDPNVLFKSIYNLVAVSFGGETDHHTLAAEIRKTGEIPSHVLERISSQPSSSLLTNEHIIELLKHFKILTEIDGLSYFMPCLLHPNNSLDLSCEALQAVCPPPLLVCFNGNYIPLGVFSALVVKLSQSSWKLDRAIRFRNQILFHTDGVFPVELIVHPAYLEFRIRVINYEEEEPKEVHQFCMEVCKTVVDTLKSILDLHERTRKTKFQLGFYCPGSFQADGQPHFCGCLLPDNYVNPKSFVCSKSPRCQDQCRLPRECTIWFEHWKVCYFLLVFCELIFCNIRM